MCDYSLHGVSSRPAKVADKLMTRELTGSHTRGFAAVGEHGAKLVIHDSAPEVAVCLLPGTELAFEDDVQYDRSFSLFGKARVSHRVARFRQIDLDDPYVQHDALEFPDGKVLKVAQLAAGQKATVLQLPAATHRAEPVPTGHVVRSAASRVTLNRARQPGRASILMPNQATAMLWQALRSTAAGLSTTLRDSFRGSKAHGQPLAATDGDLAPAFAGTSPKNSAAHRSEKKVDVQAAA